MLKIFVHFAFTAKESFVLLIKFQLCFQCCVGTARFCWGQKISQRIGYGFSHQTGNTINPLQIACITPSTIPTIYSTFGLYRRICQLPPVSIIYSTFGVNHHRLNLVLKFNHLPLVPYLSSTIGIKNYHPPLVSAICHLRLVSAIYHWYLPSLLYLVLTV
jgi:hypothetical protein